MEYIETSPCDCGNLHCFNKNELLEINKIPDNIKIIKCLLLMVDNVKTVIPHSKINQSINLISSIEVSSQENKLCMLCCKNISAISSELITSLNFLVKENREVFSGDAGLNTQTAELLTNYNNLLIDLLNYVEKITPSILNLKEQINEKNRSNNEIKDIKESLTKLIETSLEKDESIDTAIQLLNKLKDKKKVAVNLSFTGVNNDLNSGNKVEFSLFKS